MLPSRDSGCKISENQRHGKGKYEIFCCRIPRITYMKDTMCSIN